MNFLLTLCSNNAGGRMSSLCEQDSGQMSSPLCNRFLVQQGGRTSSLLVQAGGRMRSLCEHDSGRMSSLSFNTSRVKKWWTYELSFVYVLQ